MRMRKRKRPKIQWKKALDFPKCDFISNRLHFSVIEMGFWSLYVAFTYRIDCNNLRIRMAIQTYVYKITGRECRRAGWLIILSSLFLIKLCIFNIFSVFCLQLNIYHKILYQSFIYLEVAFYCALSFVKRKQTVLLLPL